MGYRMYKSDLIEPHDGQREQGALLYRRHHGLGSSPSHRRWLQRLPVATTVVLAFLAVARLGKGALT